MVADYGHQALLQDDSGMIVLVNSTTGHGRYTLLLTSLDRCCRLD